jgi:hypothetical protein
MTQPVYTHRKSTDKEANAMASNDEVLDLESPIEKQNESGSGFEVNRRNFIAALGVAGAAAGAALVSSPNAQAQQPSNPNGYAQVDVINLMLNIKYLKATLYSYITTGNDLPPATYVTNGSGAVFNAPAKITFTSTGLATAQQITDLFNEMYYDELNQLIALRAAQGVAVIGRPTMNLLGTGPSGSVTGLNATTTLTPGQAIALSQFLEDLSVTAFATATSYLTGTNLALASQALATDGFHAGALRLLSIQTGAGYNYTGTESVTFTAAAIAGSNTIYAFLPSATTLAVGYQVSAGPTIAITGDTNSNSGSTSVAYLGAASAPGLAGTANVTAIGAFPSTYGSGYATASTSHHLSELTDVPAAIAQTWAPGMPVLDSGPYFPNPGTYIVSITPNSPATTYSVIFSASSGGHTPGTISVGTTPITLSAPYPSTGAFTASTIGQVIADPAAVLPADIGPGVATTGPVLNPSGLPTSVLNQGFFATGSSPAGAAFARSFQQVLAVLYGYTPLATSTGTQTYEGGFLPEGAGGGINSVI